ncbi:hypothetical protein EIN_358570 [Entamoeba invadens IP1]|uniref:Uncharacterized protein n=2 Tax=Entamoeba invadens TaxID=33085 RepID=A0A0A1TWA7_ENTIV|nr:hypothetical protein EIN_358570 [Entamoeba invadens IP1]ELP84937.1 hypothetical protein EIN_358570 [Entamoeba invadens IP1]|eukprot:XP_004184283.1 hypothetical protein EIN_358570 [Entamoeba invadens IP1]
MAARFEIACIFNENGELVYDSNQKYVIDNSNIVFDAKGIPIKASLILNTSERLTASKSNITEDITNNEKLLSVMNFMNTKIKTFCPSNNQIEQKTQTAKDPNKLSSVRLLLLPSYNIKSNTFEMRKRFKTEKDDGACGLQFFLNCFKNLQIKRKTRASDTAVYLGKIPNEFNNKYSNIKNVTFDEYEREIITYKMEKNINSLENSTEEKFIKQEEKLMDCEDQIFLKNFEKDENTSVKIKLEKEENVSQISTSSQLQSILNNVDEIVPIYYVPVIVSNIDNTPCAIPLFDMNYFNTIQPCYVDKENLSRDFVLEHSSEGINTL